MLGIIRSFQIRINI